MTKKIESDLFHKLDQLDDDQSNLLMSQMALTDEEPIAAEMLARIKAETFAKLGLSHALVTTVERVSSIGDLSKPTRTHHVQIRNRIIAVGIASVLIAAYLVISSPEVRAQIHKVFQFLPGFAIVQDTEKQQIQYVLPNPIEMQAVTGKIEIRGLSIGIEQSSATAVGPGIPAVRSFLLHDGKGREYLFTSGYFSGSGSKWTGGFYHVGPIEVTEDMSLSIDEQTTSIPIRLSKVEQADQINDFGVTDTHHSVSLTALSKTEDNGKTKVTLLPQVPSGMRIESYGFSQYDYLTKPELLNDKDEYIEVQRDVDFPNPNEFSFQKDGEATSSYKLIISAISAVMKETKQESFTVPIPTQGEIVLNKTIAVSGFPVEITKVERLPNASGTSQTVGLKIYFNLHYDANIAESLMYFTPDFAKYETSRGAQWQVNEQTRAMEYLIVEVPPKEKEYTFYIADAHITIRGPWEFQLQ